jgi:hypothetical protein
MLYDSMERNTGHYLVRYAFLRNAGSKEQLTLWLC